MKKSRQTDKPDDKTPAGLVTAPQAFYRPILERMDGVFIPRHPDGGLQAPISLCRCTAEAGAVVHLSRQKK